MKLKDLMKHSINNNKNCYYDSIILKDFITIKINKLILNQNFEIIIKLFTIIYNIADKFNNKFMISYNEIINYYCIFKLLEDNENEKEHELFFNVLDYIYNNNEILIQKKLQN